MKLLDLFCGAGGAAAGYRQAGFTDIMGIDIEPQPNYPFDFIQGNALAVLKAVNLTRFDLIHASPPCQAHSPISVGRWGKDSARWPDLIAPTRELLLESGVPYVIENVAGARRELIDPIRLTGELFGLRVHRPRLFEVGNAGPIPQPTLPPRQKNPLAIYGKPDGRRLWTRKDGSELRAWKDLDEAKAAMDVEWMQDELEIRESIPPVYTRWIGTRLLQEAGIPAAA